ncbi:MAG: DUF2851 family protein [Lentimonas sp.]
MRAEAVQEMQGLYGPFTLTERVVQKIWLRQDFDVSNLQTTCGKRVQVKNPGRWNLLGGPDFKEARLIVDGQNIIGDVEVHFKPSDWYAHEHEKNPKFNSLVLHVVLNEDRGVTKPVETLAGKQLLTVVLMPLLERDLESYATDDALLEMERINELEWIADFLEQPVCARLDVIREQAETRWAHKLHFTKQRLAASNWATCCHQFCMEVLGYSRNRAPMARLALRYSSEQLGGGAHSADSLFAEQHGQWKLGGLRPANHPRKRLEQYLEVVTKNPRWVDQLRNHLRGLESLDTEVSTTTARRLAVFPDKVDDLRRSLFGEAIGSTRFHTMMVDAFLPLAAAADVSDTSLFWWHWWAGDCPDAVKRFLKHSELTSGSQPLCNGLVQGALGLFLNRSV